MPFEVGSAAPAANTFRPSADTAALFGEAGILVLSFTHRVMNDVFGELPCSVAFLTH